MTKAYLVDGVRTPIGRLGGALRGVRVDDMGALVLRELLRRNPQVPPGRVDEVYLGCANQAGEDNRNLARMSLLLAGLPVTVPGTTINSLCSSGMNAVVQAARAAALGDGSVFIAGGAESMTRAPYVISKSSEAFARDQQMHDTSLGWRFVNPRMQAAYGIDSMGETAENVAELHAVSRVDMDRFACASQQKAAAAQRSGRFAEEIVAVEVPARKGPPSLIALDEAIRADTTMEALARLSPAFREAGTVTAGNASGLNDGACAVLVCSQAGAAQFGLRPAVRLVASSTVGVEPRVMGMGPVPATRAVLARAGLHLEDMDLIELNEAFAAQSLACLRQLGLADDDPRVNGLGGAIALGHPLGMSGARLLLTAMRQLQTQGKRYALCTMCVGVGQGMACILERCP